MTDSPTDPDDRLELASAYVDGRVTDAERARVEADPDTLALAARLRSTARALRAVDPPGDTERDRSIAAALAVFDEAHAAHPAGSAAAASGAADDGARVVDRRDRAWWSGTRARSVLGAAAAVLVVATLGMVVASSLRDGDDSVSTSSDAPADVAGAPDDPGDDVSALEAAPEEPAAADRSEADDSATATGETESAPADAADDEAAGDDGQLGDADHAPSGSDDEAGDDEAGDDEAGDGADAPAGDAAPPAPGLVDVGPVDAAELAAIVEDLDARRAASGSAPVPSPCPDVVDPLVGTGSVDGTPVLLGRSPDVTSVRAVDPLDCSVRLEAVP